MKKFWQKNWFGIDFGENFETSSLVLPNSKFYNAFYKEFFTRYSGYNDLNKQWRIKKDIVSNWILSQTNKEDSILSIGAGLGYIEQKLYMHFPGLKFESFLSFLFS